MVTVFESRRTIIICRLNTSIFFADDNNKRIKVITRLEMVIAFLIGILFSSIVFCLAKICCRYVIEVCYIRNKLYISTSSSSVCIFFLHRKKQRSLGNLAETLEMVTCQEDSLV